MIEIICCDLDGVLCDFATGALSLFGKTWAEYAAAAPLIWSGLGVSEAAFWKSVRETPGFWANLPAFPWTRRLMRELDFLADARGMRWEIVLASSSSAAAVPDLRQQRIAWMHRNLRAGFSRYREGDKVKSIPAEQMAGALLIDDNPNVCKEFEERGGQAILFPSRLNGVACVDPGDWVRRSLRQKLQGPQEAAIVTTGGDFEIEQAVI